MELHKARAVSSAGWQSPPRGLGREIAGVDGGSAGRFLALSRSNALSRTALGAAGKHAVKLAPGGGGIVKIISSAASTVHQPSYSRRGCYESANMCAERGARNRGDVVAARTGGCTRGMAAGLGPRDRRALSAPSCGTGPGMRAKVQNTPCVGG